MRRRQRQRGQHPMIAVGTAALIVVFFATLSCAESDFSIQHQHHHEQQQKQQKQQDQQKQQLLPKSLGPVGPGAWNDPVAGAAAQQISQAAVQNASAAYGAFQVPFCLAVVKNGFLVLDEQYGYGKRPGGKVETDSAGKTITAALMGVAVSRGLFDLDTPIANYGVLPEANFSLTGIDFFPNVTARHLLTQTSGVGKCMPGTCYTYDSDVYIMHLSYLLNATVGPNYTARSWATEFFAEPLGIPDLYSHVGGDPAHLGDTPTRLLEDISAGGDQPISCSEFARVGQLILNKGVWNTSGGPTQMISEEYMQDFFRPQFPDIAPDLCWGKLCKAYSLLSYLALNNTQERGAACNANTTGLVKVLGLPDNSLLAMGWLGKYLIVTNPYENDENIVVVAMGNRYGDLACDPKEPDSKGDWATNEGIVLTNIWTTVGPLLELQQQHCCWDRETQFCRQDSDCDVGGEGCIPSGTWTERYGNVHCQSKSTAVNPGERGYGPRLLAPSPDHTAGRRWTHTENRINPHRIEGTAGSACYCYCGIAQAIGKCYDMPQNATAAQCNDHKSDLNATEGWCPPVSVVFDCNDRPSPCAATYSGMTLQPAPGTRECPEVLPNSTAGFTNYNTMQVCTYAPSNFAGNCYLVPNAACVNDTAFFPAQPPIP